MKTYKLSIMLLSDTIIGSGQGFGVLIDSDVVFDDAGIPYIPARRIKGLLRDSAEELNGSSLYNNSIDINSIFGITGDNKVNSYFSDLKLKESYIISPWLKFLYNNSEINNFINSEKVNEFYTNTRSHTAIENVKGSEKFGTAKKNSLRTVRVLKKCFEFTGNIKTDANVDILKNAALNLKWLGTKRNRGFGNVKCVINEEGNNNV